eukprot:g62.t1
MSTADLYAFTGGSTASASSFKDDKVLDDADEPPAVQLVKRRLRSLLLDRKNAAGGRMGVRYMFRRMDLDKNGFLSADELEQGLKVHANLSLTKDELRDVLQFMDRDGDDSITFNEFEKALFGAVWQRPDFRQQAADAQQRRMETDKRFRANILRQQALISGSSRLDFDADAPASPFWMAGSSDCSAGPPVELLERVAQRKKRRDSRRSAVAARSAAARRARRKRAREKTSPIRNILQHDPSSFPPLPNPVMRVDPSVSTMLNSGVEKYRNRHRAATPGSEFSSVVSTLSPPTTAGSVNSKWGATKNVYEHFRGFAPQVKTPSQKSLQNHTYSLPVFPRARKQVKKRLLGRRADTAGSRSGGVRSRGQRKTKKGGARKKRASPTRGRRVSQEIKDIVEHSGADVLEVGLENLFAFSFTPGNLPSFESGQGSPNARPSTDHGVQTHIANANDVQMQLASRFNTGIDLREEFGELQAEAEISPGNANHNLSILPGPGQLVRLKRFPRSLLLRKATLRKRLSSEIRALQLATNITSSPFIETLHMVLSTPSEIALLLENAPGGTLASLVAAKGHEVVKYDEEDEISMFLRGGRATNSSGPDAVKDLRALREDQADFYLGEILLAIEFLHKRSILHRNLRIENVLLSAEGHVKLSDFSLALPNFTGVMDEIVGAPQCMSPEMIRGDGYGRAHDWWTFGILAHELLTGESPFDGEDSKELFRSILGLQNAPSFSPQRLDNNAKQSGKRVDIGEGYSESARELVAGLLERKTNNRLGSGPQGGSYALRSRPFFKDIDWQQLKKGESAPPFRLASFALAREASAAYSTANSLGWNKKAQPERTDVSLTGSSSPSSSSLLLSSSTTNAAASGIERSADAVNLVKSSASDDAPGNMGGLSMGDDYLPDHEAPNSIRNIDQHFPALEIESRNNTGGGGGGGGGGEYEYEYEYEDDNEDEEEYKFDENLDDENEHEHGRKLDVDVNYDDEEGHNVNESRPTTSEAAVPFQLRMARVLASKARASANESQAAVTYSKAINELARLQGQALKEKEEETQRLLRESMYDGFGS